MKLFQLCCRFMALLAMLPIAAMAQVPLVNPSFETPALGEAQVISPLPAANGWAVQGAVELHNGPAASLEPAMGRQWLLMRPGTSISQAVTLQPGTYVVTLHASQTLEGGVNQQTIQASLGTTTAAALTPGTSVSQQTFASFTIATAGTYDLKIALPAPPAVQPNPGLWVDNIMLHKQGVNSAPVAAIATPVDGGSYADPLMNIVATAIDGDGSISKVEFYENGTLISTLYAAPWVWARNYASVGSKTLTVIAYDNTNLASAPASVGIVHTNGTAKPYVGNSTFEYPRLPLATVTSYYAAPYPWQGFDNVYFGVGSAGAQVPSNPQWQVNPQLGRQAAFIDPQYLVSFSQVLSLPAGSYGLTYRATVPFNNALNISYAGNLVSSSSLSTGAVAFTAPGGAAYLTVGNSTATIGNSPLFIESIKIGPAGVPTVMLRSGSSTSAFTGPAAIRLIADVEVYDRTITQVQFLVDNAVIYTGPGTPTTIDWLSVPPKVDASNNVIPYSVVARVTDSLGNVTSSAPMSLTVAAPAAPVFFNAGFEYAQGWYLRQAGVPGWDVAPTTTCVNCMFAAARGSNYVSSSASLPDGISVAVMTGSGWMQQPVYFLRGTYKIAFKASQLIASTPQSFRVLVNGVAVGTFTPGTTYGDYLTSAFVVNAAGLQTVRFESTTPGNTTPVAIDALSIAQQATVPDAPTIGTATGGNAQAAVTFTAPAYSGGAAIGVYTAYANPGGLSATCAAPCSSITIAGLTVGTVYNFTVKATNSVGEGPASLPSNPVTISTVPGAPTIGTATAGNAKATVTFSGPGNNGGSLITSYEAISSPGGISATCAFPCSAITVLGLADATSYSFQVRAINGIGTGALSASSNIITTPAIPATPYLSAGTTCTGEYSANFTAGGDPVTLSVCVNASAQTVCGSTFNLQAGSAAENGHFIVTAHAAGPLTPEIIGGLPLAAVSLPAIPTDFGSVSSSTGGASGSARTLLGTVTLSPQTSALNSSYVLSLTANSIVSLASPNCGNASSVPIAATFTLSRQ